MSKACDLKNASIASEYHRGAVRLCAEPSAASVFAVALTGRGPSALVPEVGLRMSAVHVGVAKKRAGGDPARFFPMRDRAARVGGDPAPELCLSACVGSGVD